MEENLIKECELPESLCDYLQRLDYEAQGYKALAASIINNSLGVYNMKFYKKYMNEYNNANNAFRLAMQEVQVQYAPELTDRADININILYSWNRLRFYKNEVSSCENNSCHK